MALDQASEGILPNAPALAASNLHDVELADKVREDGCAVAGHEVRVYAMPYDPCPWCAFYSDPGN